MNLLPVPRRTSMLARLVADSTPVHVDDSSVPKQGYQIRISDDGVRVAASDAAGHFYAERTVLQLRRLNDGLLPVGEIDDHPDLPVRAVMLDVSRDKVPTLDTLCSLIDRLAEWKINEVQLYIEHTFAYADHEVVWRDASPYTPADIAELDTFCRDRFIELVPQQNCLGHMERWLRHAPYSRLAASPEGWVDPTGFRRPPTTINPLAPESLDLVRGLLAELLGAFSSRTVHVGLDEPWELGPDRFSDYLSFVQRLRAVPELSGRQVLMWGDIVAYHPDRMGEVPAETTVCEWGYEADHPFDDRLSALADAGIPSWVCPGTSSWNSVLGRITNARENITRAAAAAAEFGSNAMLNTDWGDNGHLQHLPISEAGFALGAAMAWCRQSNEDLDLAAALNSHCFDDKTGLLGGALVALGDAHRVVGTQIPNNSILCVPLLYPFARLGHGPTAGLTVDDLARAESVIGEAVDDLRNAKPARADGSQVVKELAASADLVLLMCDDARARLTTTDDGRIRSVPAPMRADLAARLAPMLDRHGELWLARNRAGGLPESLEMLRRVERGYTAN